MLSEFISQVSQGLSRSNRYKVTIYPPPGLGSAPNPQMVLYCNRASIPGISFSTAPQRITGESREFVYERIYDPISLTFYVDGQMNIPQFFNNWQTIILNPITRATGQYTDYVTTVDIEILDVSEQGTVRTISLFEAFPKSVQAIDLNSSSKDVMTMTVSFVYKQLLMG